MQYKAFVASTSRDLGNVRRQVIEQLRRAGLQTENMEDWPADAENPEVLSAKRTAGCHFCVAIIGYRRGTIAINDPHQRSITELEIDTARSSGVKTLVFMLDDTARNRELVPEDLNELHDPRVGAWRESLQRLTCEYFQYHETPNVLPAIMRQVMSWEQRRLRRSHALLSIFGAIVVTLVALVSVSHAIRSRLISALHRYDDPIVFQHARDGQYKVVRLIDGRADLIDNANFREEILGSRKSFSIFAATFESLVTYEKEFEQIASQGVRIRIVTTDYSEGNRSNWEAFSRAKGDPMVARMGDYVQAGPFQAAQRLARKYPGSVEVRVSRLPMFYTMWLRDPSEPEALGHLGVNYYSAISDWPYFRLSKQTGGQQLQRMSEQFERIWNNPEVMPIALE